MPELTTQDKVVSLFQYIMELNKLKQKSILDISEYPWSRRISDIPEDPENISLFYRDRVEAEELPEEENSVLLCVHKPEFDPCPQPEDCLLRWLEPGWDSYRHEALVLGKLPARPDEQLTIDPVEMQYEAFEDDPRRAEAYRQWCQRRAQWAERQQVIQRTRQLFSELYRLYFDLQRDCETMELVVANGMLRDRKNSGLNHPVLTKRVKLRYDPADNTIFIQEVDAPTELYVIALQQMEDVNLSAVNQLQTELQRCDYHPLDRCETPEFLKILVHQLSSESVFSDSGVPDKWMSGNRLLLYTEPCYIMRRRIDGTLKAIGQIVENVQETGYIPAPIRDIVSGGHQELPQEPEEETLEEQLAAVGGESADVLLSKEANKEQLEIAKRIELYNAVLVQGPPGTGKTHTIANLMGHFLAQGKTVLVTSHTQKALRVLKDKVAPGLQNLCVSLLDDSNADMERSVDGITEYMARTTAHELKREMEQLADERELVMDELAATRRKLFRIISQECGSIVYNGETLSPSAAAAFVSEHSADLSYIPGKVRLNMPLPLTVSELADLYRSNEGLSRAEETELSNDLPAPEELLSPEKFEDLCQTLQREQKNLEELAERTEWRLSRDEETGDISFAAEDRSFSIPVPRREAVEQLRDYLQSVGSVQPWMIHTAVDGKLGGAYRSRWELLLEQIRRTCAQAETVLEEQFGHVVRFAGPDNKQALTPALTKLKTVLEEKGRVSKLTLMFNRDLEPALEQVSVDGAPPRSAGDCAMALHEIELEAMRAQCALYWDQLLADHGVPRFAELDPAAPERIAKNWNVPVTRYLGWYQNEYSVLTKRLEALGLSGHSLFRFSDLDSEVVRGEKLLRALSGCLPVICDFCMAVIGLEEAEERMQQDRRAMSQGRRISSGLCYLLEKAIEDRAPAAYAEAYGELERMHQKYTLHDQRKELLTRLEAAAPQWAEAIRHRKGVHGEPEAPGDLEEAWRWKQLSGIIAELTEQPFARLQRESVRLSGEYRRITAEYAEKCAWYHLLLRTEGNIDMRHALQGWKQTVKKIGKGTGKNAPLLKAKARELMSRCQTAVPSWIMPINRALENLDPRENRFDIVIIDEASQSDISSLAILYMGSKLIIVGDDKQVSPMAVGVEIDKLSALQQMYIQGQIPNAHLYDARTSIYDIAKTTFQPLMLREHFRCVPQIIGFSNMLSYDNRIKPLRDALSSALLPAVVNYRVEEGQRLPNKTNPNEAKAIAALMQACIEQPEYASKTFGVISLLGDEQVKVLQRHIEERIDHRELVSRSILCGNASHFQGDERDVIFLSMVDSANGEGPVRLQGAGSDDACKKRYNVAASRARDQLWVVDSLDPTVDLKPGDIRKTLIDYALDPEAVELRHAEILDKAESPFEAAVAAALSDRGYRLVQQWQVGAYRLDMVAVCGRKTVAIECDGERYHSGETRIREDMERQTILERLGWRFIRIRGSEYYRDPKKAMDRVVRELGDLGVEPEAAGPAAAAQKDSDLLARVKLRAAQLLSQEHGNAGKGSRPLVKTGVRKRTAAPPGGKK